MIHIYKNIKRIEKELIDEFKEIGSATAYEAAGRVGAIDPRIKPLKNDMKIFGSVITVKCFPGDNLMLHKAIQIAEEGDIIVASTDGCPDFGYWGSLMSTSAISKKIKGLVLDGCVRDSQEIVSMGFPVFCRGTCIKGTTKANPGLINHPISFGGVIVEPGDLIIGDADGLVVISKFNVARVIKAAKERIAKEEDNRKKLSSGISSVEINNLNKVFSGLGIQEE